LGTESDILKLIESSVDFAKNYISMLSFNFSVEVEGNFDMDIMQLKESVAKASDLNTKYLVNRYKKLTVKINTMMLEFF
jgi:hypothetical protein